MATRSGAMARKTHHGSREAEYAFNPWRELCLRMPGMVDQAQSARVRAAKQDETAKRPASHRGYYVGASVLAFVQESEELGILELTAVSSKPKPDAEGICAERRLTDRIQRINRSSGLFYEPIGLVVIGEPQPDQATGFEPETLWMCSERCWPRIIQRGKVPQDCLVVTVRPNKHKTQVQIAEEIDAFYQNLVDGRRGREPITYDHDRASWSEIVDEFDRIIPRTVDPFESPEARRQSVEAARVAIQGGYGLRLVTG
ncbi:hypothetical protein E6P97_00125 [Patescibacteria group bacterium]|nr:MAG: hypothetical protein E6P97_00125 [Patescibacteria group bacterium]